MKYNVLISCLVVMILVSSVTACSQCDESCEDHKPGTCCTRYCRGGKCVNYGDDPHNDVGPNPCLKKKCPGQCCALHAVTCIQAPCHPIPECVDC